MSATVRLAVVLAIAPVGLALADAPASRYPRDVISRVLTYPKGIVAVGADVSTSTSKFFDPAVIRPLVGYGITDELELNFAAYSFPTSGVGKGSFDAGLGYAFVRGAVGGKLELVGRVQVGYGLASKVDAMGNTSGAVNPLFLGVHAQYNISPKVAVVTPGGQLAQALDGDPKPTVFLLPVALGVQPTPELYVQLDTRLATIPIAGAGGATSTFIGADSTPVALTATYNVIPACDASLSVALDLTPVDPTKVGDTMVVLVAGRYYIGKL